MRFARLAGGGWVTEGPLGSWSNSVYTEPTAYFTTDAAKAEEAKAEEARKSCCGVRCRYLFSIPDTWENFCVMNIYD